uniref:Transcriptional regulator n=1 Tax=Gongylonema pulchrum TaxID=637853 RepID=A0A183DD18_9BILA
LEAKIEVLEQYKEKIVQAVEKYRREDTELYDAIKETFDELE